MATWWKGSCAEWGDYCAFSGRRYSSTGSSSTERVFRLLAQFENPELPDLVGSGLARVGDVAIELGLGPSGRGFPEFEVGQCLFAGPPFGVKAGIDHQTRGAEEFEAQVALQRLKSADSPVDITQDYRKYARSSRRLKQK